MFLLVVCPVHVLTSRLHVGIATLWMTSSIQLFGNYMYVYMYTVYTVAASGWRESHDLVF